MVPSIAGSRSRPSSRTVRTHRSSASNRHHKTSRTAAEEGEVREPDIEDVRRKRAAYFSRPVAERQKIIRPKTSAVTLKSLRSSRDRDSIWKKTSLRSSSRKPLKRMSASERLTAALVYGLDPDDEEASEERTKPRSNKERCRGDANKDERHRHSSRGSTHSRKLPTVLEPEGTPDERISMMAERRVSRARTPSSKPGPSLKRSNTAPSRLPTLTEENNDRVSHSTSRKSSKRESTLLGSLLPRQSMTAVPTVPRVVECLTCGSDDIPYSQSAKLACSHRMCHDCLKRIFQMSVKDPAHMPPRCCTDDHIPLKHVEKLFDQKFKVLWNRKYNEYNTKNRIYCCAPKCGQWIKPSYFHRDSHGRKYAHCSRCKTKVCILCNNKMHKSTDCPKDPEIAKLVEQAKDKGWQRCYNCNSMVELKEGCNHMTCRCLAEFCMICGLKWKTCDCPWFDRADQPYPDRLNEMRVPEPVPFIYGRMFNVGRHAPAPAPQGDERGHQQQNARFGDRTYQDEMERRRRQERLDEDLARRLQLASLMNPEDEPLARRPAQTEIWGFGNAAGHFMNDDFVQQAANVVMSGDGAIGRRGERSSGRRRRGRQSDQSHGLSGLVPDFLGDESILGVGLIQRPTA